MEKKSVIVFLFLFAFLGKSDICVFAAPAPNTISNPAIAPVKTVPVTPTPTAPAPQSLPADPAPAPTESNIKKPSVDVIHVVDDKPKPKIILKQDKNGDGKTDTWGIDANGDGVIDYWKVDTNGNGKADRIIYPDKDGTKIKIGWDTDGDGKADTFGTRTDLGWDLDGDGIEDIFDPNHDGFPDKRGQIEHKIIQGPWT